ncbi:prolipoprotein diacylglyceryl transferase [Mycolicibacterium flavescens]|uniref:prolipoprotein diacylglyceryl transferase n=1 Tax=Mycolicibacterium flavescens TaxID=1776 RepID=UPI0021F3B235|nr:prolipoprotein diacylglyceryl transferase [Mycolicibacterium flavescens]MCV7279396.1 prolipoprotein diacylglyceryl transferase [Mycolicibacterium flavescens]
MTTTYLAAIPSPAQGVWYLGPIPLRAYALFIIVGIIAALVIGDRRWEARGGERGVIYDIALWAVPFGLIGGRLYHVMTDWWRYFGEGGAGLDGVFRIWDGGLGIWGAVAFGGVGAWIACRRRGIPLPAFGDAIAPGIVLAQAIGRIGNYFNQELWGGPTTLPWALEIYERRDASGALDNLNGVSTGEVVHLVHPTFLYELLWNLLVFAVLIYVDRRFKFGHGRLFAMYVAGYCLGRFWIELLRVDDATLIDGVRINSFTSTFVFIGAVVYIMVAPKGREDPATLRGDVRDEDLTEELAAVGATAGVVAAAKAAAADEDEATKEISAEDFGADVAGVPADSVEEAEEFAVEGEDDKAEAVAEAEELSAAVAEAPAEEIAEAEEFAEARSAAEAEAGLGVVEGEEAADALADAGEAHESAVEGEAEAAELADDANADETPEPVAESEARIGAVEGEEASDAAEAHESAVEGEAEAVELADDANADADTPGEEAEAEAGLGAVEGEEASDALADATEAHESAVEGEAEAAELADEVAEAPAEEIAQAEEFAEAAEAEAGLGVVEGEEASDALADAAEAHESAVEGEAEAAELAEEASGDETPEPVAESEAGLGAVEGEEASDGDRGG